MHGFHSLWNLLGLACLLAMGCTDISVPSEAGGDASGGGGNASGGRAAGGSAGTGSGGAGAAAVVWPGESIDLRLPSESAYVSLVAASVNPNEASDWDLHFDGVDIFTNSGASGSGLGGAFGPLSRDDYFAGKYPEVPFLFTDEPSGALGVWYAYDGTSHTLYSRLHTYAVHSGDAFYKLQVLSYYGEIQGAPVSAVYSVRYAKVEPNHNHATRLVEEIDATAGWPNVSDAQPSSCLRLSDGAQLALAPADARHRADWDICFRRDNISINGGAGGPGSVTGADLDANDQTELEQLKQLTADDTLARFESLDWSALNDPALVYQSDRIVSAFTDAWLESSTPPIPSAASWLVLDHTGAPFLLAFTQDASNDPSQLTLHLRALD